MTYAKAIVAALTAFVGALYQAADGGLTTQEWLGAVLALLGSGFLVYVVPNRPAPLDEPSA